MSVKRWTCCVLDVTSGSLGEADLQKSTAKGTGVKNFRPASKSSPSTGTRTRNDLQPGQKATCQRNPPAQAAPAPPPTSTQRSTSHEYP